jgi:nucleotide-binding universal stress UspA family protein
MYYHPNVSRETASKHSHAPRNLVEEPAAKHSAGVRKILVPVDGSSVALRAIAHLIGTEDVSTVEVHLVNVQELFMQGDFALNVAVSVERRARLAAAREALERAYTLLVEAGIRCERRILFGDAAATIARYANEHGCDAIVMGTRGLGTLSGLLRGSVATKVVNRADVPVTLVKHVPGPSLFRSAS